MGTHWAPRSRVAVRLKLLLAVRAMLRGALKAALTNRASYRPPSGAPTDARGVGTVRPKETTPPER